MSALHNRLLLLASLLLLGWGIASWLEEGAPWNSLPSHASEDAATSGDVDVRMLIEQESRLRQESVAVAAGYDAVPPSAAPDDPMIELMSGTDDASTPAWLTGEIEF